jgi:hypothetical protein
MVPAESTWFPSGMNALARGRAAQSRDPARKECAGSNRTRTADSIVGADIRAEDIRSGAVRLMRR